ncbi:hypothetical protein WCE37_01160 [Luteimonas sp. MJ250]|uniref:hypothetical protein n=1 Tax=Luteimonas sp. MJ250 TaxID=3129236 RepID=UPI0031B9CD48
MAVKKKAGASKKPAATRTETLGLRLDPRLKFALELAARDQHRSISGTVEWCVERVLRETEVDIALPGAWTFFDLTHRVWDVDPNKMLANICAYAPRLATFEETQKYRIMHMTEQLWYNPGAVRDGSNLVDIEDPLAFAHIVQEILEDGKFRAISEKELESAGASSMVLPF